jgi:hypothetical protein
MLTSLASGSRRRQCRQAAEAWIEEGVEEREQVRDISCRPAAWHIATHCSYKANKSSLEIQQVVAPAVAVVVASSTPRLGLCWPKKVPHRRAGAQ